LDYFIIRDGINSNFILQLWAEGGKASKCELRKSREKKMKQSYYQQVQRQRVLINKEENKEMPCNLIQRL
jgi:hypothetical protein